MTNKMKVAPQKIRLLAVHWNKDERTIRRWLKGGDKKGHIEHPMISHQESQKIIKAK